MSEKPWSLSCSGRMWFNINQKHYLGPNRITLLEHIADLGSISKAAKAMGMSYKAAWDSLEAMNGLSDEPIVSRVSGGRGGGGTRITDHGLKLIRFYRKMEESYFQYIGVLNERLREEFSVSEATPRLRTPAMTPNTGQGTVSEVVRGADFTQLAVHLDDGSDLVATVPNSLAKLSAPKVGQQVVVFVKPTDIAVIGEDVVGEILAQNRLTGIVDRITEGALEARITVKLDTGWTLTCNQAMGSSRDVGVSKGQRVFLVFGSHDVILAQSARRSGNTGVRKS